MANFLYKDATIYLNRKYDKAMQVAAWIRPADLPKRAPSSRWSAEEDTYILTHSIEDSMATLNRSKSSVKTKLYRLNNNLV